jgi:hypothetical protein
MWIVNIKKKSQFQNYKEIFKYYLKNLFNNNNIMKIH